MYLYILCRTVFVAISAKVMYPGPRVDRNTTPPSAKYEDVSDLSPGTGNTLEVKNLSEVLTGVPASQIATLHSKLPASDRTAGF